jgi:hypothetical protein
MRLNDEARIAIVNCARFGRNTARLGNRGDGLSNYVFFAADQAD